jgi:hypothetical protein
LVSSSNQGCLSHDLPLPFTAKTNRSSPIFTTGTSHHKRHPSNIHKTTLKQPHTPGQAHNNNSSLSSSNDQPTKAAFNLSKTDPSPAWQNSAKSHP